MGNLIEMAKVEKKDGFWCVMVLSPVQGVGYICQGEWDTKQQAEADLRNWR